MLTMTNILIYVFLYLVGSLTIQRNHKYLSIVASNVPQRACFYPIYIENVLEVYKRDQDLTTMKLMSKTTGHLRAVMF